MADGTNEQIQLRRDTDANFRTANPVLGQGEPAYALDTQALRIGDGSTSYVNLPVLGVIGGPTAATIRVNVTTGAEVRPVADCVIWLDSRSAGASAPTNMVNGDIWLAKTS